MDWKSKERAVKFWQDPSNRDKIIHAKSVKHPFKGKVKSSLKATLATKEKSGTSPMTSADSDLIDKYLKTVSAEGDEASKEKEKNPPSGPSSWKSQPQKNWKDAIVRAKLKALKVVKDEDLKTYPYQSVGKIYVLNTEIPGELINTATAFYVGKNKIMTAAHVFDQKCDSAVFVPASKNFEDKDGENYGHYFISEPPVKHPRYVEDQAEIEKIDEQIDAFKSDHQNADELEERRAILRHTLNQYDVCTATIGDGLYDGKPSRLVTSDTPSSEEVRTVQLCPMKVEYPPFSATSSDSSLCFGTAIGYGTPPKNGGTTLETEGKMLKLAGIITQEDDTNGQSLELTPAAWRGMSGGPWMRGDILTSESEAIGMQSMITESSSYSPYFNKQLLDKVNYCKDP